MRQPLRGSGVELPDRLARAVMYPRYVEQRADANRSAPNSNPAAFSEHIKERFEARLYKIMSL
jgi:hypothetical protein